MDVRIQIKVATISLWNLLALLINIVAFVILYKKAKKTDALRAFFIVETAMIIWLVGKVLKTVSPTEGLRWFFIVFYYFGICLLEVGFFDFAYTYNKGHYMKRRRRYFLYGIGMAQFLIVLMNPFHYLFYSEYSFWGDEFGPLFYGHVVVNYGFILAGLIYCTSKFKYHMKDSSKAVRRVIGMAILSPIILNFIYITRILGSLFKYLGIQIFDITPLVYTWSLLLFVYATFKYDFFDVSPILKNEIIRRLDTPIIMTDHKGSVLYKNALCKDNFDDPSTLAEAALDCKDDVLFHEGRYYRCSIQAMRVMGQNNRILSFNDMTYYQVLKGALTEENERLCTSNVKLENQIEMLRETSHIGAAKFVARELHDIIGHSLVVAMRLLEVSQISYSNNISKVTESLLNAETALRSGLEKMASVRGRISTITYTSTRFEKEIRAMLETINVSGLETKFFLRGSTETIDGQHFDVMTKVITELMTNTLKHAEATSVFLSVAFENDCIQIQMMDNGRGCDQLVKGNGLNGIDARLALVGGRAVYQVEEGFGVRIGIGVIS